MVEKIIEKGKWLLEKGKEIGIIKCVGMVLCGMVILYFSVGNSDKSVSNDNLKKQTPGTTQESVQQQDYGKELETQLTEILEHTEGVGKVKVMITLAGSSEKVVNKDVTTSNSKQSQQQNGEIMEQDENQSQPATVLVQGENGEETPYVVKENNPEIAGVLVVAQGAENQAIINQITDTVAVLFSISVHKVRVMRMIVD